MMNIQVCRLCLLEKASDESMVDIFGSQLGKVNFCDKIDERINWISGLKISKNDGLPTLVCQKCLIVMENFFEFRCQIQNNDEKLRKILNLPNGSHEEQEEEEDQQHEIVKLDPNKIYESSEDEVEEHDENKFETSLSPTQNKELDHTQTMNRAENEVERKTISNNHHTTAANKKKEIYHCKFCDIVFPDQLSCSNHENYAHDPINPFECLICKLKINTQPSLIIHIKNEHKSEKPYLCAQCPKAFIRRSDLRKHVFVHAGIRLFNCDICNKSFTRSTNLAKHKRSHNVVPKNYRCMLCPKAFQSNDLLSRHMEVHMNRNTFNCKFCNLVFTHRDELEVHQRSHVAPPPPPLLQLPPMPSILQQQPLGFYNQIQLEQQVAPSPPTLEEQTKLINFYSQPNNSQQQQQPSLRSEYPIMNQLLSNFNPYKCDRCPEAYSTIQLLQSHQSLYHSKNFSCSLCNLSYYKKKELDRHITSIHTDIKFNCSKCSKSFSRKDKLLRHEKTHLVPQFYNCALCAGVFIRKHLLDLHMKIHELPPMMQQNLEQPAEESIIDISQNVPPRRELPALKPIEEAASFFPINLSMSSNDNEPMDLSNDKNLSGGSSGITITKIDPPKIIIDDSDDDLKIIENVTPNGNSMALKTDNLTLMNDTLIAGFLPTVKDGKSDFESRMMEPSKDLPMEILQSPN